MNKGFVPLNITGAPTAEAAPRPKGSPAPPAQKAFQVASAAGQSPQGSGAAGGEPKITLERQGDRITCIRIQCSCGHIIEVACTY